MRNNICNNEDILSPQIQQKEVGGEKMDGKLFFYVGQCWACRRISITVSSIDQSKWKGFCKYCDTLVNLDQMKIDHIHITLDAVESVREEYKEAEA